MTPPTATTVSATTSTGRPLDEELSDAILDAAIELIGEEGYAGVSIAAVAQRAGVHRPAIYRRWPGKLDLVVAALRRLKPPPPDRDTGRVRDDLVAYLIDSGYTKRADQQMQCVLRLHADMGDEPDLAEAIEREIVTPRRELLRRIVERGIARKELRADLDVDLTLDVLQGAIQVRKGKADPMFKPAEVERVVDLVVGGARAV
jgi:AcrR family transcriptional regulator